MIINSYNFVSAVSPISLLVSASASNVNTSTTSAIDTTGATLLVVSVHDYEPRTPVAPTDSKGNTYVSLTAYSVAGDPRVTIWYCKNPSVGASHTFSEVGSANYNTIIAAAFNNTDTAANADQESGTSGTAATMQPGSITPTTNNQLIIAALTGAKASATIDSGFTEIADVAYNDGVSYQGVLAYKVQTTAAAVNPTWTVPSSGTLAVSQASFKHS